MNQTYWDWKGQKIYYVKSGDRNEYPALLLVHGFGASTDHWRKNIEGLNQYFEVYAIDLLGFGKSAKPEREYTGKLWQEQLNEFIHQVIGKTTIVAGNSLGGYASLCVGANHPELVGGLILINSAGPFETADPAPKLNPVQKILGNIAQNIFKQSWGSRLLFQYMRNKSVIKKTLQKVYLDQSAVTDRLVEEIYRPSCDPGAEKVFASVFKSPSGEKVNELLEKLKSPLLMLWGEGDPWMNPTARGERFKKYYPTLIEYYLKAGHCPHDEIPEEVNKLIKEFVLGNF
ncbi:MAG TPA: alpha/beta fold hydrolase [Allocoleopsis sp.]